ncbi:hypothetical protein AgCh_021554 [Apium graveolens]
MRALHGLIDETGSGVFYEIIAYGYCCVTITSNGVFSGDWEEGELIVIKGGIQVLIEVAESVVDGAHRGVYGNLDSTNLTCRETYTHEVDESRQKYAL